MFHYAGPAMHRKRVGEAGLSGEKIGEVAREVNARLFTKLAEAGDDLLSREARGPRPPSAQTVGEQLAFLALHDSYHVGQLAYVRKALGLPGVVG